MKNEKNEHDPSVNPRAHKCFYLLLLATILTCLYPTLAESSYTGSVDLHATIEIVGAVLGLIAGLAFAEIKRRCEGQTVPIIALTAKAMKEDRQQLLEHGFADYVAKPIECGALMKTIDKHLAAGVTASPEDRSYQ